MGEIEFIEKNNQVFWKVESEQAQKSVLSWRMLENNEIKGLLTFNYYYVDNRIYFHYNCQNLQRLGEHFKRKSGDFEMLYFICEEILKVIVRGQEYLLEGEGYLLSPEWIFWNWGARELKLCYLPGRNMDAGEEYIALVEYLMQHTEHKDKRAVAMIYGLYDMLTTEGFIPEQLLKYLQEVQGDYEQRKQAKDYKYFLCPQQAEEMSRLQRQILDIENNVCPITGEETVIGRKEDCHLWLPFGVISQHHAILACETEEIVIIDTGSTNGTYLNGNRIPAYVRTTCKAGDVITFADIPYKVGVREKT